MHTQLYCYLCVMLKNDTSFFYIFLYAGALIKSQKCPFSASQHSTLGNFEIFTFEQATLSCINLTLMIIRTIHDIIITLLFLLLYRSSERVCGTLFCIVLKQLFVTIRWTFFFIWNKILQFFSGFFMIFNNIRQVYLTLCDEGCKRVATVALAAQHNN